MKVSVLMLAYNHENYIAEALSSVLMQEVDFDYEIVVGEDFSTDGTRRILKEFCDNNPGRINAILQPENFGMHANLEITLGCCIGEYVAVLECDDYWTDKNKLQKQVDFMDGNKHLSECFHKVMVVYQDGSEEKHEFPKGLIRTEYGLDDVLSEFFIPTLSVLFRRSVISKFPPQLYEMANPDWLIHILCSKIGRVGFIDQVMGVYRVHQGGVWSGVTRNKVLEGTIASAEVVNRYLDYKYSNILDKKIIIWHFHAFISCINNFKFNLAIRHWAKLTCKCYRYFLGVHMKKVAHD